jgi:hypothetical protein
MRGSCADFGPGVGRFDPALALLRLAAKARLPRAADAF